MGHKGKSQLKLRDVIVMFHFTRMLTCFTHFLSRLLKNNNKTNKKGKHLKLDAAAAVIYCVLHAT